MDKFIALSPQSKKVLELANLALDFPVNIIITGDEGVGKRTLAHQIVPKIDSFNAKTLEQLIINNKIILSNFSSIIVIDLQKAINIKELLFSLKDLKIIATINSNININPNYFTIHLHIPPLSQRQEDLKELISIYTKKAQIKFGVTELNNYIIIDTSKNSISLKQSIYKSILLSTINKDDIFRILFNYFTNKLTQNLYYKDLLQIFDIPLLKATRQFSISQVKMAKKLGINRITLRKKLDNYFHKNYNE